MLINRLIFFGAIAGAVIIFSSSAAYSCPLCGSVTSHLLRKELFIHQPYLTLLETVLPFLIMYLVVLYPK